MTGFYVNCYGYDSPWFQVLFLTGGIKESYGCGVGIVGGGIGECGIEGGADRVVRNGSKDGLAASGAFKSMACPQRSCVDQYSWEGRRVWWPSTAIITSVTWHSQCAYHSNFNNCDNRLFVKPSRYITQNKDSDDNDNNGVLRSPIVN